MWNVFMIAAVLVGAVELDVQTLDGRKASGTLESLSAQKVVVRTADGVVSFDRRQLLTLTPRTTSTERLSKPQVWIDLADGSKLLATSYQVSKNEARIDLVVGQTVKLPTRVIRSVRFREQNTQIAPQWKKILNTHAAGDLIVIRKAGEIDSLEGVVGDVGTDVVKFKLDKDVIPVNMAKIEGIVYHASALDKLPEVVCRVDGAAGSKFHATSISIEKDRVRITTPVGLKLTRPLETISNIDYKYGKVRYLSDMQPESIKWTPYFGSARESDSLVQFYRPRHDQALDGGKLKLGKEKEDVYDKGLAIHSRTLMVYRIRGDFRRFKAIAGIDESVRDRGHVLLVISGDDKKLFEATITGKDKPRALDLDIRGIKRLTILVDFGEDLDIADHLDLCEARITK